MTTTPKWVLVLTRTMCPAHYMSREEMCNEAVAEAQQSVGRWGSFRTTVTDAYRADSGTHIAYVREVKVFMAVVTPRPRGSYYSGVSR